jgi:hypothetical protein
MRVIILERVRFLLNKFLVMFKQFCWTWICDMTGREWMKWDCEQVWCLYDLAIEMVAILRNPCLKVTMITLYLMQENV